MTIVMIPHYSHGDFSPKSLYSSQLRTRVGVATLDGSCNINQFGSWIASTAHSSTGVCAATFVSGYFSASPVCFCSGDGAIGLPCTLTSVSSSGATTNLGISAGTYSDNPVNLICIGYNSSAGSFNPNALTNTATNTRIESAKITAAASVTQNGSWISSASNPATGKLSVTITSGIFSAAPTCWCTSLDSSGITCRIDGVTTSTSVATLSANSATSTASNVDVMLYCQGAR